jgi:putative phosphoesterase
MAIQALRVGVLADTHGHLDPKIAELFKGVDHIFHAGDIGLPWLILDLEEIAPVTAVLGNNDAGLEFKETEIVSLKDRKFFLHHIIELPNPADRIKKRIIRENPDVVIFGHTHKPFCEAMGQTLYFNPGYAGKPRFKMRRTVAVLNCDESGITAEYLPL